LEGGPADQGGMLGATTETDYTALPKGGDLITAVDDQPVRTFSDLLSYLVAHKSPGDSMNITVLRDGISIDLSIVLTKRPD
jgi:S1-C subfamily serine protease